MPRRWGNAGQGVFQTLLRPRVSVDILGEELKVSAYNLQEIVEVVCNTARKIAKSLHLLRLAQGHLRGFAFHGFFFKL